MLLEKGLAGIAACLKQLVEFITLLQFIIYS